MVRSPHRFTAAATALLALLAQLAGVCPASNAAAEAAAARAPEGAAEQPEHRCCARGEAPQPNLPPAEPPVREDGSCRHCAGVAAVSTLQPADHRTAVTAGPALDPFSVAADTVAFRPAACDLSTCPTYSTPPPALWPPTLLDLRCALNL